MLVRDEPVEIGDVVQVCLMGGWSDWTTIKNEQDISAAKSLVLKCQGSYRIVRYHMGENVIYA